MGPGAGLSDESKNGQGNPIEIDHCLWPRTGAFEQMPDEIRTNFINNQLTGLILYIITLTSSLTIYGGLRA